MFRLCLSLLLLVVLFQGQASADFFKWEDDQGNIHITDYPPPDSARNTKIHQAENNADTYSEKTAKTYGNTAAEAKATPAVVLYTTSWCPYCKKAKDFFRAKNISFTEYDIEQDPNAAQRKKQLDKKSGVPFAIVNGQHISGYSPREYEEALQKQP